MSCYRLSNSITIANTSPVDGACFSISDPNTVAPCCPLKGQLGFGNLCLNDFLCWESDPPDGASGYLTASCTDESYRSGQCTPHCISLLVPDVIYNYTSGLWHCCGGEPTAISCGNPTDETFQAPAPEVLTSSARASSSAPTASTTQTSLTSSSASSVTHAASSTVSVTSDPRASSSGSAAPTAAASAASSASSSSDTSSTLSTGAKAGVGVGIAVGVLFIISLAIWFWMTRRRRRSKAPQPAEMSASATKPWPVSELSAKQTKHEMAGSQRPPVELSGSIDRNNSPRLA